MAEISRNTGEYFALQLFAQHLISMLSKQHNRIILSCSTVMFDRN